MGKSEFPYTPTFAGSDSGYGEDIAGSSSSHPLSRKGYEIGPAAKLKIGDVFEFLWADCVEFEWDWKCLGYTRFIVLRHSDSFPHYCACVPISCGPKQDFAKPGIDTLQQGYVYASGERDKDTEKDKTDTERGHYQTDKDLPKLPYSSVGIHVHSSRHRVKENSRANYADVIEIDHEAQVMVIGDVSRYFDRIRKNVNKAFMRQILRQALEGYCTRKREKERSDERRSSRDDTAVSGERRSSRDDTAVSERRPSRDDALSEALEDIPEDYQMDGGSRITENVPVYLDEHGEEEQVAPEEEPRRPAVMQRRRTDSAVGVRPGMDRADLRTLKSLRGRDDDDDDTRSLRSMAMAGRASRSSLRR